MQINENTAIITTVGGVSLIPLEYNGVRVIMTAQLAELYDTTNKIISYNFNSNKDKYVDTIHYFMLDGEEAKEFRKSHGLPKSPQASLYLWTETGALFHAKSIKNERAWFVYQELVNAYFRLKEGAVVSYDEALGSLQGLINLAVSKINELTRENNRLKLMSVIDGEQQGQLQGVVKQKILEAVGGDAEQYRKHSPALNSEVWAIYRRKFHLNSFRNTPVYLFDEAVNFLENWNPCQRE
jgi:hypothetical protein